MAFGILDHEGKSYLTIDEILNSFIVSRSGLTPQEITIFFEMQNIFKGKKGQMIYSKFREMFFPHMTLAGEDPKLEIGYRKTSTVQ